MSEPRTSINLIEYKTTRFGNDALAEESGAQLYRQFGKQVDVQFPSPRTEHQWELTSQGWVGYIPLSEDFGVRLDPKVVGLTNLFRMLDYAYKLELQVLEDITNCGSLEEFYERLAKILAQRITDRSRKGLYRTYVGEEDQLPFVRGRWKVCDSFRRPWEPNPLCEFEQHVADNEENQIIAWTLLVILRSGLCTERVLPNIRQAFRLLQNRVTLSPRFATECVGRMYNRLNVDYHPMHALCRFFLEHAGPTHQQGDRAVLPFLVNMAKLFELFVAIWLSEHISEEYHVRAQQKVDIDEFRGLRFAIDLVLVDGQTQVARCILDTKYKVTDQPEARDIEQVVAYAESMHCREAVLVYPQALRYPLDRTIGRIRVRSLSFRLDGDLEFSGRRFLMQLLEQDEAVDTVRET